MIRFATACTYRRRHSIESTKSRAGERAVVVQGFQVTMVVAGGEEDRREFSER